MNNTLPAFDPTNVHAWQVALYTPSLTPPPPSSPPGLYLHAADGTHHRLQSSTEALIQIAPLVGLPTLELENLPEWMIRLWVLHDLGFFTEFFHTEDGPAGLRLTSPALLLRHLNLAFPGLRPLSPSEFDLAIRCHRLCVALDAIPEVPCPRPPTSRSPFHPPPS